MSNIPRTTNGLSEYLFSVLDQLAAGQCTPQHAKAATAVAQTLTGVARLQIDFARFVSDQRAVGSEHSLKDIRLG